MYHKKRLSDLWYFFGVVFYLCMMKQLLSLEKRSDIRRPFWFSTAPIIAPWEFVDHSSDFWLEFFKLFTHHLWIVNGCGTTSWLVTTNNPIIAKEIGKKIGLLAKITVCCQHNAHWSCGSKRCLFCRSSVDSCRFCVLSLRKEMGVLYNTLGKDIALGAVILPLLSS